MVELIKIMITKKIKMQTEYQMSFLVGSFGAIFGYFAQALMIVILIGKFKTLGGWGPWEVAFIYGLNLTAYTLGASFFYHFMGNLPHLVRTGGFDEILIRPINPMLYLMLNTYTFTYLFRCLLGIGIVIVSLIKINFMFTFYHAFYMPVVMISGGILQAGFFLFFSVPVLWQIKDQGIGRILFDFRTFTNYPISIFPGIIQFILTFIIPYGFISFFPAEFIFKKQSLFNSSFAFLSLPVGILFFTLSYLFWKMGLSKYQSTGS